MTPLDRLALNDQGFAFDPATGEGYALTATARTVIDHLRRGAEPPAIAAALAQEHGIDATLVELDVRDFLDQLRRCGLA